MPRPRRKAAAKAKEQISENAPVSRGSKKKEPSSTKADKEKEAERNESESEDQLEQETENPPTTRRSGRRTTRRTNSQVKASQPKKARGGRKTDPKPKQAKDSDDESSGDEEDDSTPEETDVSSTNRSKKKKGKVSARRSKAKEERASSNEKDNSSSSEQDEEVESLSKKAPSKKKRGKASTRRSKAKEESTSSDEKDNSSSSEQDEEVESSRKKVPSKKNSRASSKKKTQAPKDDQSTTSLTDVSAVGTRWGKQRAPSKRGGRKSGRSSNESESEQEHDDSTTSRPTRGRKAAAKKNAPSRKSIRKPQKEQPSSSFSEESDNSDEEDTTLPEKSTAKAPEDEPEDKDDSEDVQTTSEVKEGRPNRGVTNSGTGRNIDGSKSNAKLGKEKDTADEKISRQKSSSARAEGTSTKPRTRRGKRDRQTPVPETELEEDSSVKAVDDSSSETRRSKRQKKPSAKVSSIEEGKAGTESRSEGKASGAKEDTRIDTEEERKTTSETGASGGVPVEQEDLATAALMLALASGTPVTSVVSEKKGKPEIVEEKSEADATESSLSQDHDKSSQLGNDDKKAESKIPYTVAPKSTIVYPKIKEKKILPGGGTDASKSGMPSIPRKKLDAKTSPTVPKVDSDDNTAKDVDMPSRETSSTSSSSKKADKSTGLANNVEVRGKIGTAKDGGKSSSLESAKTQKNEGENEAQEKLKSPTFIADAKSTVNHPSAARESTQKDSHLSDSSINDDRKSSLASSGVASEKGSVLPRTLSPVADQTSSGQADLSSKTRKERATKHVRIVTKTATSTEGRRETVDTSVSEEKHEADATESAADSLSQRKQQTTSSMEIPISLSIAGETLEVSKNSEAVSDDPENKGDESPADQNISLEGKESKLRAEPNASAPGTGKKSVIDGDSEAAVASMGIKSTLESPVASKESKVYSNDTKMNESATAVPTIVSVVAADNETKQTSTNDKVEANPDDHINQLEKAAEVKVTSREPPSKTDVETKEDLSTTSKSDGPALQVSTAKRASSLPEKKIVSDTQPPASSLANIGVSINDTKEQAQPSNGPNLKRGNKLPSMQDNDGSVCQEDFSRNETSKPMTPDNDQEQPTLNISQSAGESESKIVVERATGADTLAKSAAQGEAATVNQRPPPSHYRSSAGTEHTNRVIAEPKNKEALTAEVSSSGKGEIVGPKDVPARKAVESRQKNEDGQEKNLLASSDDRTQQVSEGTERKQVELVKEQKGEITATSKEVISKDIVHLDTKSDAHQEKSSPTPSKSGTASKALENSVWVPQASSDNERAAAVPFVNEPQKLSAMENATPRVTDSELLKHKIVPVEESNKVPDLPDNDTQTVLKVEDTRDAVVDQASKGSSTQQDTSGQLKTLETPKGDTDRHSPNETNPKPQNSRTENELKRTELESRSVPGSTPTERKVKSVNSLPPESQSSGESDGITKGIEKREGRNAAQLGITSTTSDPVTTFQIDAAKAETTDQALKPIPQTSGTESCEDPSKPSVTTSTTLDSKESIPVIVPDDHELSGAVKRENDQAEDSSNPPAKRAKVEQEEVGEEEEESVEVPEDTRAVFDFEGMKIRLYSEGFVVHQVADFERIFANYLEGMRLRFDGINSSSKIERSRSMINQFLTTRKLRKLHNKMIKGLLGLCLRKKIPYDEISNLIPPSWRKKINISSEDPIVQSLNVRTSSKSPKKSSTITSGNAPSRENLGYLPAIGGVAAKPYRHKQTSQTCLRIPGAFTIDSELKTLAHSKNMKVSETAVWAAVASAKEYASSILQGCVALKKSMHNGRMKRSRPTNVPAPRPDKKSKKELNNPLPMDQRHVSSFDIQAFVTTLPTGSVQYHGGAVSRNTYERTLLATTETSVTPFGPAFYQLKEFIWDKLAPQYTMPVDFQKPKPLSIPPSTSNRPTSATGTSASSSTATVSNAGTNNTGEASKEARQKIQVGGLGRGAKDLASLKMRSSGTKLGGTVMNDLSESGKQSVSSASKVASSARQPTTPSAKGEEVVEDEAKVSGVVEAVRPKGKGFGIKDLAAMKARTGPETPPKDN